ncbi:hypothetical protein Tsubulata_018339 [Turnera subulata]|uniref:Late embryogenesis abundant protein LEA-2 subgroup domain-containing protein n=1 Tax=Turnera subulata TaxID=218843 RepID=A0A9Q0G2Y4_9ROSI|nr:hypothetical protein Tsubulata_018339 [Turnera subulata]
MRFGRDSSPWESIIISSRWDFGIGWLLWRNDRVFSNCMKDYDVMVSDIVHYIRGFLVHAHSSDIPFVANTDDQLGKVWRAPSEGVVKVNVDAAVCQSSGVSAVGGVARNASVLLFRAAVYLSTFSCNISLFNVTGVSVINLNTSAGNIAKWTGQIRARNPHSKIGIDYERIDASISTGCTKLASGQIAPFNQKPKDIIWLNFTLPYTRQAPVLGLGSVIFDLDLSARVRFEGVVSWARDASVRSPTIEELNSSFSSVYNIMSTPNDKDKDKKTPLEETIGRVVLWTFLGAIVLAVLLMVLAFADIRTTFYDISCFTLTGLSVINLNTSGGNTARWTGQILAYNPHSKIGIDYGRIGAWISTGDSRLASGQIAPFNQGPKGETRLNFTLPYTSQAPVLGLGPVLVDLSLKARYRFHGVNSWVNYARNRHISCENIELDVVASGHGSGTTDIGLHHHHQNHNNSDVNSPASPPATIPIGRLNLCTHLLRSLPSLLPPRRPAVALPRFPALPPGHPRFLPLPLPLGPLGIPTGLSFYIDAFIPYGGHCLLAVASGVEGSILDLLFLSPCAPPLARLRHHCPGCGWDPLSSSIWFNQSIGSILDWV